MNPPDQRLTQPELLRTLEKYCGLAVIITFFMPYASDGDSVLMSWDIASKGSGKFAFLMCYPILAGLTLGLMPRFPNISHTTRAIVTALVGLVPMVVFVLQISALTNMVSLGTNVGVLSSLGMVALAFGLTHRMLRPNSLAARWIIGAGMLLMLLYYFIPQKMIIGEKVMPVVGLFRALGSGEGSIAFFGVLSLLPLLGLLGASAALSRSTGEPAMERRIAGLAWFFLGYLPGTFVLLAVAVLVEKPGLHLVGMLNTAVLTAAYLSLFVFGASHVLAKLESSVGTAANSVSAIQPGGAQPVPTGLSCQSCGGAISPTARFCECCGALSTPRPVSCHTCGGALSPSARFCEGCGDPTEGHHELQAGKAVDTGQTPSSAASETFGLEPTSDVER